MLAAGASRRAGGPKALATLDGETFVSRAVRVLLEGGCDELVVVVGPPHGDAVASAVPEACVVRNPTPERGMLSSLKVGLEHACATGWHAAVVSLVDQPRVRARTVSCLLSSWRASGADLVRPRFRGRRGHPYVISRAACDALVHASDAQGARPVLRSLPNALDLDVDDPAVLEDLDLPRDIAAAGALVAG